MNRTSASLLTFFGGDANRRHRREWLAFVLESLVEPNEVARAGGGQARRLRASGFELFEHGLELSGEGGEIVDRRRVEHFQIDGPVAVRNAVS